MVSPNTSTSGSIANFSNPVALSNVELWIQLIFFYGFLAGFVSTSLSILICVGIWRNKNLRSRFFVIAGCLTFCRALLSLQILCIAIFRSLRTIGLIDLYERRIICHAVHLWIINGLTLELSLLCTLVVDRMIAIIKTNYYRLLGYRSAFYVCLAQYVLVSCIKLIPSYMGDNMYDIVPCIYLYNFLNVRFNHFSQIFDLVLVSVILILYIVLIFVVKRKVKLLKTHNNNNNVENDAINVGLRRQLALMPILRNLVLLHCGLSLMAKFFLFAAGLISAKYGQRFTAIGGYFTVLDILANVVSLLVSNGKLRRSALPCCGYTATITVGPTPSHPIGLITVRHSPIEHTPSNAKKMSAPVLMELG